MIVHKNRPPFGVTTKRFCPIGYHPVFETRPGTFKYPHVSPGCYDSKLRRKIVSKVPRWKRQQEVEEFCRRLCYKGDHLLKEREWAKSINGPGWQDTLPAPPRSSIGFTKSDRFPVGKSKSGIPGPGTYGKNHNPFLKHEEKTHAKGHSFSNIPTFEQYSRKPRGIMSKQHQTPPPNMYKIKSSIDELSRIVSKKGPYQIFTVARFPNMPVNNLAPLPLYKSPLCLSHHSNYFKGKFYRCGKDSEITSRIALQEKGACLKKNIDVGPGTYDPYPARVVTQTRAPFNSSVREVRPSLECGLSPPPGRYYPSTKRRILGDGMKSVFISKTKRDFFNIQSYKNDEETKRKNVDWDLQLLMQSLHLFWFKAVKKSEWYLQKD